LSLVNRSLKGTSSVDSNATGIEAENPKRADKRVDGFAADSPAVAII